MPTARVTDDQIPLSNEILYFMQRMWNLLHALDVRSKRMAKRMGVTGPQRLVIRILGRAPAMTAGDVAGVLGIHPSTLSGILSRLEAQNLLARRVDENDRRCVRFHLTAAGRRIDRERKGTVEAAVRRALGRADPAMIDKTARMLELLTIELTRDD